jgi:PTH1 family peptidyl-tRNA hydrolase
MLLKPSTYMNRSGPSVLEAAQFYKLDPVDQLVVYDELDLPLGQLRLRKDGSAGGHRGLADIIRCFGDDAIPRVRVGIGNGRGGAVSRVLGRFRPDEIETAADAVERAADAVECWLTDGIEAAMNRFNAKNA